MLLIILEDDISVDDEDETSDKSQDEKVVKRAFDMVKEGSLLIDQLEDFEGIELDPVGTIEQNILLLI